MDGWKSNSYASAYCDGSVDYDDGTDNNAQQLSADVTHFLHWAAEPEMEERKKFRNQSNIIFYYSRNNCILSKKQTLARRYLDIK